MPTVVDTMVLHYFLVVDQAELLLRLLDPPVGVPRIVYDPDDAAGRQDVASELRKNIRYEERLARSTDADGVARAEARQRAERLQAVAGLVGQRIEVLDLSEVEFAVFARLTAEVPDDGLGLMVGLGPGEAACLAIGLERGWTVATDDNDALRVLRRLADGHPYERIRRLLTRAATDGLITREAANTIHRRMRETSSWDHTPPFPEG